MCCKNLDNEIYNLSSFIYRIYGIFIANSSSKKAKVKIFILWAICESRENEFMEIMKRINSRKFQRIKL